MHRKTHEQFVTELALVNPNIKIVGKYETAKTKIECECLVCNYKWKSTPNSLLHGKGCKACGDIKRAEGLRKSNEQFVSELKNINPDIKPIGKYKGALKKIEIQCLKCGHIWFPKASYLLQGSGCPECHRKAMTKSHEDFVAQVKSLNPNIKILSPYVNYNTDVHVKCDKCGNEWVTKAGGLSSGNGCPKCATTSTRLTHEEFIKRMRDINKDIEILGEYATERTKIECHCKKCGMYWMAKPNTLLRGSGCRNCANIAKRKPHDEFVREIEILHPDLEILSEYTTNLAEITCRCKKCGRVFNTTPKKLKEGYGCILCNKSRGEKAIYYALERKGIPFNIHYSFEDCKDVNVLPFDFYIPKLNTIIEYDGEQHFHPVDYFGGIETFNKVQKHDKIKTDYCEQNGIRLIRIPYTEFNNIENIINKQIVA